MRELTRMTEEQVMGWVSRRREVDACEWVPERGYVATFRHPNKEGGDYWSEGIEYVVLDSFHVAWRVIGDWRVAGDWQVSAPDEFLDAVVEDIDRAAADFADQVL